MRNFGIWIALPLSAVCLSACKPKDKPATTETPGQTPAGTTGTPATSPATTPEAPTKPQVPALSSDERAAKLGFARHLPADTQCIVSVHNGAQAVKRIKASQFWNIVSEMSGAPMMGQDNLLDELEEDMEEAPAEQDVAIEAGDEGIEEADAPPGNPAKLLEREVTLAFGVGTAKQTENLLTLNRRVTYHQMKNLAALFAKAAEEGNFENFNPSSIFGEEMVKGILNDKQAGVALFSLMNMPPIYAAFLSNPDSREADTREMTNSLEMISMMGEMVTEVEVEVAGSKFIGKKILGAKIAASMAEGRAEAAEFMGEQTFDKLVEEIAKKDLVVLTGTVGEYVVFFIGSSEKELRLVTSPAESLAGTSALTFADPYISKDVLAYIHGSKELVSTLVKAAGGFKDIADGLRDGITGTKGLGDTRDIEALLQLVTDKESELKKLQHADSTSSVFYFEDGLKGEFFGGIEYGAIDWTADNRMGDLGKADSVFFFANLSTPAGFDKAMAEYYEAILETGYTIALKVAEKSGEDSDFEQFKQGIGLFDTKFRVELVNIWKAFSVDMENGLGRERAWVLDLKGTVPPIPGIPQPIVDKAKFPRLSIIAPVVDRSKLASSWKQINESATRVLGHISEMTSSEIPMQKPISTEKDGLTTWFFSFPFFNDDFMPSVTIGDQWFATSTSKVQALDLIKQAAASKTTAKGAIIRFDFKVLQSFLKHTIPVVTENAEALKMSEDDLRSLARVPDAIQELDSLEIKCHKENGVPRTSIHFKTR